MPYYWWVRQRLEEKSGQGLSRKKKTKKESFAPVVEDDDEGAREGECECLEGGVERDSLWRGLDIRDAGQIGSSQTKIKECSVYVCQTAKALRTMGEGRERADGGVCPDQYYNLLPILICFSPTARPRFIVWWCLAANQNPD
jgi:hypothetical protein